MRISDWSSDVCSSDLFAKAPHLGKLGQFLGRAPAVRAALHLTDREMHPAQRHQHEQEKQREAACPDAGKIEKHRSAEHTSELQSLMHTSYAVFSSNNNSNNSPVRHSSQTSMLHRTYAN